MCASAHRFAQTALQIQQYTCKYSRKLRAGVKRLSRASAHQRASAWAHQAWALYAPVLAIVPPIVFFWPAAAFAILTVHYVAFCISC